MTASYTAQALGDSGDTSQLPTAVVNSVTVGGLADTGWLALRLPSRRSSGTSAELATAAPPPLLRATPSDDGWPPRLLACAGVTALDGTRLWTPDRWLPTGDGVDDAVAFVFPWPLVADAAAAAVGR